MLSTYGFCCTYYITNREQIKQLILTDLDTVRTVASSETTLLTMVTNASIEPPDALRVGPSKCCLSSSSKHDACFCLT